MPGGSFLFATRRHEGVRGNMDTLLLGTDFRSSVLKNIALTRQPHIKIEDTFDTDLQLPPPVIFTAKGVLFGFAPQVDYLLNRIVVPPLVNIDAVRRGLEMTVFYALIDREYPKLQLAEPREVSQWVRDLAPMLAQNRFYTGKDLSVCDCALVALLDFAHYAHQVTSTHGEAYARRFADELAAIKRRNEDDAVCH